MDENILYSVKFQYRESLEYLYKLAQESEEGYFHIDISEFKQATGYSKRTLYNHIGKLSHTVFTIVKGVHNPNELDLDTGKRADNALMLDLLRDSGINTKGIGSLYYMPIAKHTGITDYFEEYSKLKYCLETLSFNRDKAILKYCFRWHDAKINHFFKWSECQSDIYESYQSYLNHWDHKDRISQIRTFIKSNDYQFLLKASDYISPNGFYKSTEESLELFFKYMVYGNFDWDSKQMDKFQQFTA